MTVSTTHTRPHCTSTHLGYVHLEASCESIYTCTLTVQPAWQEVGSIHVFAITHLIYIVYVPLND